MDRQRRRIWRWKCQYRNLSCHETSLNACIQSIVLTTLSQDDTCQPTWYPASVALCRCLRRPAFHAASTKIGHRAAPSWHWARWQSRWPRAAAQAQRPRSRAQQRQSLPPPLRLLNDAARSGSISSRRSRSNCWQLGGCARRGCCAASPGKAPKHSKARAPCTSANQGGSKCSHFLCHCHFL